VTAAMGKKPGDTHVVIVGAGLSGALLACLLGRRGYRVTLHERRDDPRVGGVSGGRSINLALSCRGLTALARVGLDEAVLKEAIPMRGRMLHAEDGKLTFQRYSQREGDAINSVSRGKLNMMLLDAAEACDGVEIMFGKRCVDAELDGPTAVVLDEYTNKELRVDCDVLIGADGAFSAVRGRMQMLDRFDYSQDYLEHGYKELVIPPAVECRVDAGKHDGFAMDPGALHIWPRGGSMMIALPNADRTFTCTLFWPFEGTGGFDDLVAEEEVRAYFDRWYPDASALMPALEEDYLHNPVGSLATIRCYPWHVEDRVVLIGDAAHAVVPFYGQGINCGFEDCRIFDELLDEYGGDFWLVFRAYTKARKVNADAIAVMALGNFVEMRDRVSDAGFLLRKRVEHALTALDSERFTPLYNLVSFTNMPYAEAKTVGGRVVELAERIASTIGVEVGSRLDDAGLIERVRGELA